MNLPEKTDAPQDLPAPFHPTCREHSLARLLARLAHWYQTGHDTKADVLKADLQKVLRIPIQVTKL